MLYYRSKLYQRRNTMGIFDIFRKKKQDDDAPCESILDESVQDTPEQSAKEAAAPKTANPDVVPDVPDVLLPEGAAWVGLLVVLPVTPVLSMPVESVLSAPVLSVSVVSVPVPVVD